MFEVMKNFSSAKCWEMMMMAAKPSKKHNKMQQKQIFPLLKKPFLSKQRKLNGFVLFCFNKARGNAYISMRNFLCILKNTIEIWVRWNKKWTTLFFEKTYLQTVSFLMIDITDHFLSFGTSNSSTVGWLFWST